MSPGCASRGLSTLLAALAIGTTAGGASAQGHVLHATISVSGQFATDGRYRIGATVGQVAQGAIADPDRRGGVGFWYLVGLRGTGRITRSSTPAEFFYGDVFPNPFVQATTLIYELPDPAPVTIDIYDVGGRRIRQLAAGPQSAGVHNVEWDGRDADGRPVPAGLYVYTFEMPGFRRTRKLTRIQ